VTTRLTLLLLSSDKRDCLRDPGQVKLISGNKVLVELRPTGYQFGEAGRPRAGGADCTGESDDDWDDWLVIRGDVTDADGRSWSFADPCLTACEAKSLSVWLDAVSRNAADQDAVMFTEPNISFFVDGQDGDQVRMRVRFSYESLPGWLPRDAPGWRTGEYFVALELSTTDLAEAARTWDRERQAFPAR
jgi:hypothetical protein